MSLTIQELFAAARQAHVAGALTQAEQLYQQVLAQDPAHADSLHSLGIIAYQQGQFDKAVGRFGQAIARNGQTASYHSNLGNALQELGQVQEAVESYQTAIALTPDFADAHYNLALALNKLGRADQSVSHFRRAVELKPNYPQAYNNLGAVLLEQGHFDQAAECFRQAIALAPNYADAHSNLGNALVKLGQFDHAIASFCKAIGFGHNNAETHYNLGIAYQEQQQLDQAHSCYQQALAFRPDWAQVHYNLGGIVRRQGDLERAIDCYRRAIELQPDYPQAYSNLGCVLAEQGLLDQAIENHRKAIALNPNYAEAYANLGSIFQDQGRQNDAIGCYQKVVEINPDFDDIYVSLGLAHQKMGGLEVAAACFGHAVENNPNSGKALGYLVHQLRDLCSWGVLKEKERLLLDLSQRNPDGIAPFSLLASQFSSEPDVQHQAIAATPAADKRPDGCARQGLYAQLGCALAYGRRKAWIRPFQHPGAATKMGGARIKLGYLSSDFREHPVAVLIAELIERHDRSRFEVTGYAIGPEDNSPLRQRLKAGFDRFVELGALPTHQAALKINQDDIDILIDLNGYTRFSRPDILAFKPAPIQVNFLGYPGTMGTDYMDYIIADGVCIPKDHDEFYAEKVIRLPDTYQPNDSKRRISDVTPSRAECGLPETGFVFCSFNSTYKITPDFFAVWMKLLGKVPGSVLWLLDSNPFVKNNLRRVAAVWGINPDRLVFAPRVPLAEHLARHRLADLFLDTLPYNAHTTASDALWAGLPVLTCLGQSFAGRVAASLLTALHMPELIAESVQDYQDLALQLATDPACLSNIRSKLQSNLTTAPLFDMDRYTKNFEAALLTMHSH